ncbi:MAG: chorismate-binding protein [Sulfuritalea sp.]|jgi:para-aminobenzoate synthetase/4-amino-4-deoxychorismate lyase|nr:chorismate-binding protein [Sulfuritalea sp.]
MPPDLPVSAYCEIDFPDGEERFRSAFSAPESLLVANGIDEVPEVLARAESKAREGCWVVGFVAYEAAGAFDAALATRDPVAGLPAAMFAVYRGAAPAARQRADWMCGPWRDISGRERFDAAVASIRNGIVEGDYYQIDYTTRLRAAFRGDSLAFFDALRQSQPTAWCAYLDFGRWQVCSVSPELFFHWQNDDGDGRALISRPMKGTAARNEDARRDADAALRLRQSAKECAENVMIVDLVRNDLSRVARLGTVAVPELFAVEKWPTVWQMTSTVACRSRDNTTLGEVFAALFPCGSVAGAPKAAAMAAIARLETAPRGVYCGAIGLIKPGGEAVFSVGIRTAVVDAERGVAECGIGSGIVMDSAAAAEYAEWQSKRIFLDRACPDYELLETLRLRRGRYWLRHGHLQRLERSARALGFPFDGDRIAEALSATAASHGAGDWRVRLRLATDGAIQVETFPLDTVPAIATVELAASPVASANPWLRHKTTRRSVYESLAVTQEGIFDTLLYNERNEVTEFTRANLVVELDGRLVTPPLDCGLLPGVYRQALLARKRVCERIVKLDDLEQATALWFVNSVRGAVAVRLPPR